MEEVLPPQTEEGAGFESTRVRQFTIFLENKVGRLQTLVRALEDTVGPIVAVAIEESGDSALVRLMCSDPDVGRDAMRKAGFTFTESELLAVELPKRTRQPLVTLCASLLAAEINIHYAYPLLSRPRGGPVLALYVDDPTLAARLLIRKGFTLIGESDLRSR
ncbi:MAG: acetolactate synthase [Tepidisphaeraceae bacterium]